MGGRVKSDDTYQQHSEPTFCEIIVRPVRRIGNDYQPFFVYVCTDAEWAEALADLRDEGYELEPGEVPGDTIRSTELTLFVRARTLRKLKRKGTGSS